MARLRDSLPTGRALLILPVALAGFSFNTAASDLLEVNFSDGYAEGEVSGQAGGLTGGPWQASGPLYQVEKAFEKGLVLRVSRHDGAVAYVPLARPLSTDAAAFYIGFDAYRATAESRAYWAPAAAASSPITGVGVTVLSSGMVELITDWNFTRQPTGFQMAPERWHRFELEVNGEAKTFNAFVQVEGEPGRKQIGKDLSWAPKNKMIGLLRISQPDGGPQSVVYTDRIDVKSDVAFPFTMPLQR